MKERIDQLAEQSGESAHALMIRLLEERVSAVERHRQFIADAEGAENEMRRSGLGYAAEDVYLYLEDRIAGRKTPKPKPVKWRG